MVSLKEIEAASPEIVEVEKLPSTELTLGIGSSSDQTKWPNSGLADPKKISDPNTQGQQNTTPHDPADDNSVDGASGGPTPMLDEGQAIQLDSNNSSNPEMDPKRLKRYLFFNIMFQ